MSTAALVSEDLELFGDLPKTLTHQGHRVLTSTGIVELDRFIRRHTLDVLVIDLKLDDAQGHGLIALMRERCPRATIIVIAESCTPELELKLRSYGVVHISLRPVDTGLLSELVTHCIANGTASSARERIQ
ncbi:hypothetical protein ACFL01_01810 [Planctomycetota bacterium]